MQFDGDTSTSRIWRWSTLISTLDDGPSEGTLLLLFDFDLEMKGIRPWLTAKVNKLVEPEGFTATSWTSR